MIRVEIGVAVMELNVIDPLVANRGIQVVITSVGKSALDDALPIVSKAIHKYFLDQLTSEDMESITKLAERTKKGS